MKKRKITVEVEIDDKMVKSIEDLEREILAQNIYKQVGVVPTLVSHTELYYIIFI